MDPDITLLLPSIIWAVSAILVSVVYLYCLAALRGRRFCALPSDCQPPPGKDNADLRRHSSVSDVPLDSNVLRKVASLTLQQDKTTLDQRLAKPKFVPEKLDFQLYEKFEGQMLINWFVSAFADDHYLRQQLRTADLRLVAAQFCTHLLAAGVLRQLPDKDVPLPQSDNLFRPDLIYFWSHTEAVNAAPPTPGRLPSVAWPPPLSPSILQDIELHCNGSSSSFLSTGVDQKHENEKYIITELAIKVQQQKQQIQELETIIDRMKQEKERNKTLADIQSLVEGVKADFQSPTKEKVSVPPQNSGDTGGKLTQNGYHYNSTSRLESKIISPSKDQNSEGKFTSILITERVESNREGIGSPESATSISLSVLSPEKVSVDNTETASSERTSAMTSPTNGVFDQSHLTEVSNDVVHPDVIHTNESEKSSPQKNEVPKTEPNHESDCSTIPPPPPISGLTSHTPGSALPSTGPTPPPPPPMEGMISSVPPPPPMSGTGMSVPPPPPPPMAGMGISSSVPPPPPPPMAGMGISSPAPPPPPPMAGIGISPLGPVPPPPPIPGMGLTPIGTPSSSVGGPPPPPPMTPFISGAPPPPPTPGGNPPPSPAPFPSPPVGGWNAQKAHLVWTPPGHYLQIFRKLPVNPVMPMKPLYWTRVVVPPTVTATETDGQAPQNQSVPLWGELEEVNVDNIDEFSQLFSRQVVDKKNTKKKVVKPVKTEVAKILDSKRSQNVGILAQSLHVDFSEIENAIYNFDTTTVSLEALQQIYDVRASEEELAKLRDHASAFTDQPLDKPEQFLLELADIPHFAERIACFMFQTEFSDNISGISSKLNNIKSTCQFLMSSESLKTVLGIILALGNYMNGGNMQRGQADGFGLEILAKLKDVKSKDNSMTLLHFIVITYMKKCGDVAATESKLPVPEPSDIDRASAVQFDDIESQLNNLDKELNGCQKKMETVISKSLEENVQPFKEKMETFLTIAKKQLSEEFESCEECKRKFFATLKFYQFHPKGGVKEEEIEPKDFFPLWAPFCSDFKNLWQKEQQRIIKEKLKEAKKKQEERKEIKKGKRDAAGLKSQLRRLEERLTKT